MRAWMRISLLTIIPLSALVNGVPLRRQGTDTSPLDGQSLSPSGTSEPASSYASDLASPGGECLNGGTPQTFTDSFQSSDTSNWNVLSGNRGIKYSQSGAVLTLNESMSGTGGVVVQSRSMWSPPLSLTVTLSTSGAPGIVNPFILKGADSNGDEIDLEIVQETFQTPVWKNGQRLREKGGNADIDETLASGTEEPSPYAYSYNAYNPTQPIVYELIWTTDSITWSVGGQLRVTYSRKDSSSRFPTGPLPVRFGIWSTQPGATWAGQLDWSQNTNPDMRVQDLTIKGCRTA